MEAKAKPVASFNGARVLTLESRRGQEMSRLIETYGGVPLHAPAMREVPVASNPEVLRFAEQLFEGKVDAVIFLTGVGARALLSAVQENHPAERFYEALRKTMVMARGPKPLAVLREWKVPVAITVPEPNTWRELLQAIDDSRLELREKKVAVQEYGVPNTELLEGLRERGANLVPVVVYQWDLPEDLAPLRAAVDSIIARKVDVALFTTSVQVVHLFRIAEQMGKRDALKTALGSVVKASIGPTTSEALNGYGLTPDLGASHPKMGFLVKEAAEQAGLLLEHLRAEPQGG
jgi:uroporphyrinogen-III synthase